MNPLYLIAILAGAYGLSRMSASSVAAAKTAAGGSKTSTSSKFRYAGGGGTPLQQVQAAIAGGKAAMAAWAAATSDAWLDDNHNAMIPLLNVLMQYYNLTGGAGQRQTAYLTEHPELVPYLQQLHVVARDVHALVYKLFATTKAGGLLHKSGPTTTTSSAKSAKDLLTKAQSIINSFPSDGSDASAYVAWIAVTAAQVPSLVSDIQSLVANASNAQQDIAAAMALIPQLTALVSKATSSAATSSGSGNSGGSTDPSSYTPSPTTTPSDTTPSDPSA